MSELGIVVGLVVATLAVLTPALKHAAADARARICQANQGMIVRGLSLYVADEGVYPFSFMEGGSGTSWQTTNNRYALGCLSRYVGGPATSVLEGKTEGQFPAVYLCPSADKPAVFANNPTTMYQACYWVNMAIRANMSYRVSGYTGLALLYDGVSSGSSPPSVINDTNAFFSSRTYGMMCPQAPSQHWRSYYHPRPDTVRNPAGMMFSGDTNNVVHVDGNHTSYPGDWQMRPGYGWVGTLLGFERHGDTIGVSYVDGHARLMPKAEAVNTNPNYGHFATGETTGDPWLIHYVGTDGCTPGPNFRKHVLPAAVCN